MKEERVKAMMDEAVDGDCILRRSKPKPCNQ